MMRSSHLNIFSIFCWCVYIRHTEEVQSFPFRETLFQSRVNVLKWDQILNFELTLQPWCDIIPRTCSICSFLGISFVCLQDLFMRITLDSICQVGFGVSLGSLSPELPDIPFAKAFDTVNEIITIRFFNAFWPIERALNIGKEKILKKEVGVLNSFTANIIHQRRLELQGNNRSKVDLLSRFMSYNENEPDTFTDKELQDAILNFVIAGRDTSAISLSWFIFCICVNPHVADMVFEETKDVFGLQDSMQGYTFEEVAKRMSYETLSTMHYRQAALTETLRLYPAVPRVNLIIGNLTG
ncbi:hypothetical protein KP509_24G047200 [Ceratopteris richardii]|uniref:Cytochrome P450 n=1 Tax=Ceratopteris richardii TaxID=49495 RepID=A0A8T2RUF3_CERRI|nr:hypothetical protein KP509_24G047200 [Ceratopteris richardii]